MRGKRMIAGGSKTVCDALYVAVLRATRFDPAMYAFFLRLKQQRKSGKAALVAVMRKMIIILNARMQECKNARMQECKNARNKRKRALSVTRLLLFSKISCNTLISLRKIDIIDLLYNALFQIPSTVFFTLIFQYL
ncbi:hypothetical protein OPR82_11615 [Brucella sp. YY2X]|uniref:Transposase IS116/IS110/IS902 family protein n=1 Tax=Ochrobactrum chromiisoli TaxID=2993941 RepID=A0ABT3QP81_9HYPH|nr:hypothetical protein [Ochrobactrum chromiisoli]MCX2697409.1 hypothetical protein [Ochrobactrum chromiisoli]